MLKTREVKNIPLMFSGQESRPILLNHSLYHILNMNSNKSFIVLK